MLRYKQQSRKVVSIFRFVCLINLFPVRIELNCWETMPGTDARWMSWSCQVSHGLYIAHSVYKCLSLAYYSLLLRTYPIHQMVFHAGFLAGPLIHVLWYFTLHISQADADARITTLTLMGCSAAGSSSLK